MQTAERAAAKKLVTLLDLCVSSLRRGHANLLCIVPILTDDLLRGSIYDSTTGEELLTLHDVCVSSLRMGHANILCVVPSLTDGLR